MKQKSNCSANPIAQLVRAHQLDVAIDRAKSAQGTPDIPVVQAVWTLAREAQPDAGFVAALSVRLRERYITAPISTEHLLLQPSNPVQHLRKGKLLMRLSWGMTIVCTVLITLTLVLLIRPAMAPAKQILAKAADATARRPGMVEHIVVENHLTISLASAASEPVQFSIVEEWRQLAAAHDAAVITTARSTIHYAIADVQRQMPVSWAYESAARVCYLTRSNYPKITREPGSDSAGCIATSQSLRPFIPELAAPNIETGLQLWINRLQADIETLVYEQTTFFGKPAFSFSEKSDAGTFTLYIDPETTFPLGFVAHTPTYNLTQIVHIYEIIAADAVAETPFTWPPASLGNAFEVELRQ